MPTLHLTDKAVRALSTSKAQEHFTDGTLPGFRVRVSRTGRRTFELVYRSPYPIGAPAQQRPQRRLTLGTYPRMTLAQARARAAAAKGDLARGIDPQGPLAPLNAIAEGVSFDGTGRQDDLARVLGPGPALAGSVGHLAAEYLLRHAWPKKKRTRDDEGMLRRDLLPAWRNRPAAEIRRRDVIAMLDQIAERGAPIAARRTKALISKLFNFGISRDLVEHNPTAGVLAPGKESKKTRWLNAGEINAFWNVLGSRGPVFAAILKTILLTAQRPGEVCRMEWSEVADSWWEIPGEKTKNGRRHRVLLAPSVLEILKTLEPLTGQSRWVFASRRASGQPLLCLNRVLNSVCRDLGFSFTPHDLRRTAATYMGRLGVRDEDIERVLNHIRPGVIGVYNLYEGDREKAAALTLWADHLQEILRVTLRPEAGKGA